jgi:hypothetical protein
MKTLNIRFGVLVAMIVLATLSRFLFLDMPNFTTIGAVALFGGAYFSQKRWAVIVTFASLWLSNLILDNVIYTKWYPTGSWGFNWSVFLAFGLVILLGTELSKKLTRTNFAVSSLASAAVFFIITNFAVWLEGSMYPANFSGLITCYVAAIPFFGNTLLSQLVFGAMLFGIFEMSRQRFTALKTIQ